MVKHDCQLLIDTTFTVERTHKAFLGTPLLTVDGKDHTFTFGCLRDFLRLRRDLGIKAVVLVIGKEAHSLTSRQNIDDLIAILTELSIPCIHDPLQLGLHIIGPIRSLFSHIFTADRRFLQLCADDRIVVLPRKGRQSECDRMSSQTVETVMGIAPKDVPTYLALTDASSPAALTSRQAIRLVELYGSLELIYKNQSRFATAQIRRKLAEHESTIRRYYVECSAGHSADPIPHVVPNISPNNLDTRRNRQLLRKYGFHSLLSLLPNPAGVQPDLRSSPPRSTCYHAVVDRSL